MSRVLITGVSSRWGGPLAQALEREPAVEAIVGIDTRDPRHEFERTEFVRVDTEPTLIRRILVAAAIDTVIDTRLITDPLLLGVQRAREVNVEGTVGLLSACAGPDTPVRKLVFRSSAQWYGSAAGDPAFFTEDDVRSRPARSAIERDVVAAEDALSAFAAQNRRITVTVVRCASEIGAEPPGAQAGLLARPFVPGMLGFDPRCQFIHDDDVIGVLSHTARHELPGTYNAAADGVLALSEVAALLGKRFLPIVPPWGAELALTQLRRLGFPVPLETLRELRFGRGVDNRRLKAAGYVYRYTSREAVLKLRAQQRLRPLLGSGSEEYRYTREVEEFLRWSPAVQATREHPAPGADGPDGYDELSAEEVISLIGTLEPQAAERLRQHEASGPRRRAVLEALDRRLSAVRR